jgi:hypothetical protein
MLVWAISASTGFRRALLVEKSGKLYLLKWCGRVVRFYFFKTLSLEVAWVETVSATMGNWTLDACGEQALAEACAAQPPTLT